MDRAEDCFRLIPSAGSAGAILIWGQASEGAVEAPSDEDGG
jgi:hypothetical protein